MKHVSYVALCPTCKMPHHYVEVKFPLENDIGGWEAKCCSCSNPFVIFLDNPMESFAKDFRILRRFDEEYSGYQSSVPIAKDIVRHSIDMNEDRLHFNFDKNPIYRCEKTNVNLEKQALEELKKHICEISDVFDNARNYILATNQPSMEHVVIKVQTPCSCGLRHKAVFYFPLRLNDTPIPNVHEMWLADVDGSSLTDVLTGIFSKTFLMEALEKLIARWRLKYDQIIIACPFIAHQFMKKEEKLKVWEWILGVLDPQRTHFITRSASYKDYKTALLESGLDHSFLLKFGLENQIIGAGAKKQDFHAKVYIGLGDESEILSGSANLVPGKSLENASFSVVKRKSVEDNYLIPLGASIPQSLLRAKFHLVIEQSGNGWRANTNEGASPI